MESAHAQIEELFQQLFEDPENRLCFDCNQNLITCPFASVNNGILICLKCAEMHRLLGRELSKVRAKLLDVWTHRDIEMMKNGGNQRLRHFFTSFSMPRDMPIANKYRTRASRYYRELLESIVDGSPVPKAPAYIDGCEVIGEVLYPDLLQIDQEKPMARFYEEKEEAQRVKENIASGIDMVKNYVGKATDLVKNAAGSVNEKIPHPNITQGIVDLKDGIVNAGKGVAGKTVDLAKGSIDLANRGIGKTVDLAKGSIGLANRGIGYVRHSFENLIETAVDKVKEVAGYSASHEDLGTTKDTDIVISKTKGKQAKRGTKDKNTKASEDVVQQVDRMLAEGGGLKAMEAGPPEANRDGDLKIDEMARASETAKISTVSAAQKETSQPVTTAPESQKETPAPLTAQEDVTRQVDRMLAEGGGLKAMQADEPELNKISTVQSHHKNKKRHHH